VQRADIDRPLDTASADPDTAAAAAAAAPPPPAMQPAVQPDLDALARQVYDVLKRRLAVEQRRAG
jgi:hypothetical protein